MAVVTEASPLDISSAVFRTCVANSRSRVAEIRAVGPDTLSAATSLPELSRTGAAAQHTPISFSSRSYAIPLLRIEASSPSILWNRSDGVRSDQRKTVLGD